MTVIGKSCCNCGGSLPLSTTIGCRCPHCGVTFGGERQSHVSGGTGGYEGSSSTSGDNDAVGGCIGTLVIAAILGVCYWFFWRDDGGNVHPLKKADTALAEKHVELQTEIGPVSVSELNKAPSLVGELADNNDLVGEPIRDWTDSTGRHKIRARLLGVSGTRVRLMRENNTQVILTLEKLSEEDQKYLQKK